MNNQYGMRTVHPSGLFIPAFHNVMVRVRVRVRVRVSVWGRVNVRFRVRPNSE